ncbi:hypothetical protein BV898_17098 [Hypsibius exemplaris]|uniref:CAS1 domain-containing protein 1 n=1 Tax=Hypsibius exemplaris TaxID=2072580 RepID=A0A9X6NHE6_HYPEX|nr:hypothetical protein BV898_17098 [Hypsibius exemplaris]
MSSDPFLGAASSRKAPTITTHLVPSSIDYRNLFLICGFLFLFSLCLEFWLSQKSHPSYYYLFDRMTETLMPHSTFPFDTDKATHLHLCGHFLTSASSCSSATDLNITNSRRLNALSNRSLAIIGDSRMRDLFVFLRSMLMDRAFHPWQFQEDAHYFNPQYNASLYFVWCRYPDGHLQQLLKRWYHRNAPDVIVFGIGVWSVYQFGPKGITMFQEKLHKVANAFERLQNRTTAIWVKTLPGNPKSAEHASDVTVEGTSQKTSGTVEQYGDLLADVGGRRNFTIWSTAHDVALAHPELYRDQVHPGFHLVQKFACQLLSALDASCSHY